MKKFKAIKTLAQIELQCSEQGIPLNTHMHDTQGWDCVVVNSVYGKGHNPGHAFYNTFNGKFWGTTPSGVDFDSNSTKHENEPWFQQLLEFFYVEKEQG